MTTYLKVPTGDKLRQVPLPTRLAAVEIHLSMPPFTHRKVRESPFMRSSSFRLAERAMWHRMR